ncbi:CBS domain-containing protein [Variovorax sp. RA8]|uniref:CBS domain-containing protein n=1 Tax=Variovorax sp. (strain JCM 16519 / RA8) TaxID=662548 RepID=UPI0013175B9C|nr:CBS domain-containing protein [Variovorax sp. RA8]VTU21661.1 Hypoxic response protein 1 [Variovorax sp. RA8]
MNIGSICTRRMIAVDSSSTLAQAAGLMREHHVGALIVTSQTAAGPCVTGVVTDRDLVIDVLARGLETAGIKIGELASDKIASVPEETDIAGAMAVMEANGVRRVLVTDSEKRVTGIVSLDDLMDACAKELAGLAAVIRSGIEREVAESRSDPQPPKPMPLRVPAVGTAGWTA